MKLKDCFEKELLRKVKIHEEVAVKEINNAYRHLENANRCMNEKIYDLAIVSVYTGMFHAAISLLFQDSIKERSHLCIIEYLKDKYPDLEGYVPILDNYRRSRHTMLHWIDVELLSEDAEEGIISATKFIDKIEKKLKSVQTQEEGR